MIFRDYDLTNTFKSETSNSLFVDDGCLLTNQLDGANEIKYSKIQEKLTLKDENTIKFVNNLAHPSLGAASSFEQKKKFVGARSNCALSFH